MGGGGGFAGGGWRGGNKDKGKNKNKNGRGQASGRGRGRIRLVWGGASRFPREALFNMSNDPFKTRLTFDLGGGRQGWFYSLPALEKAGIGPISRLPISIRIVLESVLRNVDGKKVAEKDVRALANWNAKAPAQIEIPFVVARIVLQDFTGVPLLVDLAAMRSAVHRMGRDANLIEPLVPVDLVVDHSVQVDFFGAADSLQRNMELEFKRNRE